MHELRRGIRAGILVLLLLLLFSGIADAIDISACGIISSSGSYTLTSDILNSAELTCISITASDVIFDGAGHTIDGVDGGETKGVYALSVSNVTVSNLMLSDWYDGIRYSGVTQSDISNITSTSNYYNGVYFLSSSYSNISNSTITQNYDGLELYLSSYINITSNNISSNNNDGIYVSVSDYNNLFSNTVNSNSYAGIELYHGNTNTVFGNSIKFNSNYGIRSTYTNIIYNNLFNNTNNAHNSGTNIWNISKTAGSNIMGGSYLGGNFWGNLTKSGFSETCSDVDLDGICDSSYTYGVVLDYLPLTYPAPSTVTISCPIGWCYVASNYSSTTLLALDNLFSTDTVQGHYNATTQKYESHRTGYSFNQNVAVAQKEGYYYYFSTAQDITTTPGSTPSITLKTGWNLVGNYGSSARTLSALKSSVGASATSAKYYDKTLKTWVSTDSQSVPAMESFFVYVTSQTDWSD
jgi:parallel beta-helix repeat protein